MSSATIFTMPLALPPDPQRQWKIDHVGHIDKSAAKVLILFFASIALIASICRVCFRLHHDRKLFAHDFLIIFATLTLIPLTVVVWILLPYMYIIETVNSDPTVVFSVAELFGLLDSPKWVLIFFALAWTTVFAIKFSFLIFFRTLIRNLSIWLTRWFWFSVVLTTASYVALVLEPVILCPHVGMASIKCYPSPNYRLTEGLTFVVCFADILTDLIVISFPIILLSMSQIQLRKKLGIAVFCCLSITMVILTIIRIAGGTYISTRGHREFSMTWTHVLLHVEASVAILMGSLSAFRSIFTNQKDQASSTQSTKFYQRLLSKLGFSTRSSINDKPSCVNTLPQLSQSPMTNPTLRSLKEFIRRHDRTGGQTTLGSIDQLEVEDYHQYRKKESCPMEINVTRGWEMEMEQSCGHTSASKRCDDRVSGTTA